MTLTITRQKTKKAAAKAFAKKTVKNTNEDANNARKSVQKVSQIIDDKEVTFEIGVIASQSYGVIARAGNTMVLCTLVIGEKVHGDFLQLSCNYIEKFTAVNRIPGGYKKREGAASDGEVMIVRTIDRALRSIIDWHFPYEMQITVQVLSYDGYATDVLAISAASIALNMAGVTSKRCAAAKISESAINASRDQQKTEQEFTYAINQDGKVIMLEFTGMPKTRTLFKSAFTHSVNGIAAMEAKMRKFAESFLALQNELLKHVVSDTIQLDSYDRFIRFVQDAAAKYVQAMHIENERVSKETMRSVKYELIAHLHEEERDMAKIAFDQVVSDLYAKEMMKARIGGRKYDELRKIEIMMRYVPNLHGNALFTRGETQALVSITLGQSTDAQSVETLHGLFKENFLLHYNFPSYAVYEIGKMNVVGRREVGHGELARRALLAVLPEKQDYVIRAVSDITSSNGSSSMASVCGASLALFDAGVPLEMHVAGISIGLVEVGKKHKLLVDISAQEDAFGMMDFKVAGTKNFITAMQLDIKNQGVEWKVLLQAIKLAHKQIKIILDKMHQAIDKPAQMAMNFEKRMMRIDPSKIRLVIGKEGSVVNKLSRDYGVKIDIEKSGRIFIKADSISANLDAVVQKIDELCAK